MECKIQYFRRFQNWPNWFRTRTSLLWPSGSELPPGLSISTQGDWCPPYAWLHLACQNPHLGSSLRQPRQGLRYASSVLGLIFLRLLWSAAVLTSWGGQRGWSGCLGAISGENVGLGWQHLVGWQVGHRSPNALQLGCCQTGAQWESSWLHE